MEFWPEDLVLIHGARACPIDTDTEAPLLIDWLLVSLHPAARPLAERLAEAQDPDTRAAQLETHLVIRSAEAQAIRHVLDANWKDLCSHHGLRSLRFELHKAPLSRDTVRELL